MILEGQKESKNCIGLNPWFYSDSEIGSLPNDKISKVKRVESEN